MTYKSTGRPAGRPKGSKSKAYNRRLFFIDNKLYKRLEVRRHENLVLCWSYEDHKTVGFVWTDAKRRMKQAYSISEVAKMCNRDTRSLRNAITQGKIKKPTLTYSVEGKPYVGSYRFSDEDILNYHSYLVHETNNHGWQRKDGRPKNPRKPVPTRAEILSLLKTGATLYARTSDGTFVPVWQEEAYL